MFLELRGKKKIEIERTDISCHIERLLQSLVITKEMLVYIRLWIKRSYLLWKKGKVLNSSIFLLYFLYLEVDLSTVEAVQLDTHTTSLMGEEADTLRASYIRRLAAVLLQHIPAFWRLALSVFSGKFAKVQYS